MISATRLWSWVIGKPATARLVNQPPDPDADAAWELWYRDSFDRECPPQCELSGCGLVRGLMELWARYLFESIRLDGQKGFSHFHLWSNNRRIDILEKFDDTAGQVRLRRWMFGTKDSTKKGYVEEADAALLEKIATAHAALLRAGETNLPLFAAAVESADLPEFERKLRELG
ncbi:MAG: hypothetical protein HY000_35275 [Planctomycetes bacterium]|nr:hypothetical protein [Planctomycetota bacterium]